MKHITVLIAEDHTIVREGICKILELDTELEIVGEAENGRDAVALAKKFRPAVVLMDVAMPLLNGFEATRQILKSLPNTKVLILSAYSDEAYVANATDAGAVGFLLKQTSAHEVCRAIRDVYEGKTFFASRLASFYRDLSIQTPALTGSHTINHFKKAHLTPREREVLQLIAEGKANKETAAGLGISIKTVEKHREHLMRKLDIHDTAGLTRHAIAAGVIESSVRVTIY